MTVNRSKNCGVTTPDGTPFINNQSINNVRTVLRIFMSESKVFEVDPTPTDHVSTGPVRCDLQGFTTTSFTNGGIWWSKEKGKSEISI